MPTTPLSSSLRTRTSTSLESALARTNSAAVLDSTLLNLVDSFSGLDRPLELRWTCGDLCLLVICVGTNPRLREDNWQAAVEMNAVIQAWRNRSVSLVARQLSPKRLYYPNFWYVARVVPPPWRLLDRLNAAIRKFVLGQTPCMC